jgi:hypothetical protein
LRRCGLEKEFNFERKGSISRARNARRDGGKRQECRVNSDM